MTSLKWQALAAAVVFCILGWVVFEDTPLSFLFFILSLACDGYALSKGRT